MRFRARFEICAGALALLVLLQVEMSPLGMGRQTFALRASGLAMETVVVTMTDVGAEPAPTGRCGADERQASEFPVMTGRRQ